MSDAPSAAQIVLSVAGGTPRRVPDDWRVLESQDTWDGAPGAVLPLEQALAQRARLAAAAPVGVWIDAHEDAALAAPLLDQVALIGVRFPKFTDGRGYSTAVLLRTRLGWKGELRALGDVLQDQLFALRRVGFTSFALRAGSDAEAALRAFAPFSTSYQGSVDQPLPLFRRTAPC